MYSRCLCRYLQEKGISMTATIRMVINFSFSVADIPSHFFNLYDLDIVFFVQIRFVVYFYRTEINKEKHNKERQLTIIKKNRFFLCIRKET